MEETHLRNTILASLLLLGISVAGCSQKPTTTPTPAKSGAPVATASKTASATPSASPSASASASPTASATPGATKTPKVAPEVGFRRLEYDESGVEFSVPENFADFEKLDGGWLASMSPDKKIFVVVRSKEWKEWDEVLKGCDDLFNDFKASDADVTKDKTSDGIEVWYDFGAATIQKKPYAVLVAGYQLQEHDFDMVIAWDPDDKKMTETAVKILKSVTRQEKFQKAEDAKEE